MASGTVTVTECGVLDARAIQNQIVGGTSGENAEHPWIVLIVNKLYNGK